MLVSFIIPSYNSAHTVKRCLDSIYALSLKPEEFEVIFIDDCSTDNTVSIIEDLKSQVSNLTLLRQPKNNRQGAARNRGVSVAKGEYICFVDSDDAVTEGIVDAIRLAKEKQTDMVACHYADANENGEITSPAVEISFLPEEVFTGIEMQNKYPYWCSAPCEYVFSNAFLKQVNYPFAEGVLYEDSDFVAVHLYYAKRMAYTSKLCYIAYYREGSTTHSISYKNVSDYLLLGARMLDLYEKVDRDESEETCEGRKKIGEVILDGACYNVSSSCLRMVKLSNSHEVSLFYDRVDEHIDRKMLCEDKNIRKYYWNAWIALCLKYKRITLVVMAIIIPLYNAAKRKKMGI